MLNVDQIVTRKRVGLKFELKHYMASICVVGFVGKRLKPTGTIACTYLFINS